MPDLAAELHRIAVAFGPCDIPAPVAFRLSEHPIWPHARAAMTDPEAIRLRLQADIVTARALCGYIDQAHHLAGGWTEAQLARHFVPAVNALAAAGRLPPLIGAKP